LVPEDFASELAACDADNLCVPDELIESGGDFIPDGCRAVGDLEGRCLSRCLPSVSDMADLLDSESCPATHLCVPCYNPLDGTDTGACSLSCDSGPVEPAPEPLQRCCGGIGQCVPSSAVPPEDLDRLGADTCSGSDLVCAPDVFIDDPSYSPPECTTLVIKLIFGPEFGPGRCLPECLPDVQGVAGAVLMQDGCADAFVCAPCLDPLSGEPSGACDR
jgi:hypothetical protein